MRITHKIQKLYFLFFYKLVQACHYFDRKEGRDINMQWAEIKGLLTFTALVVFLLFAIRNYLEIYCGILNFPEELPVAPQLFFLPLAIIIYIFIYFTLDRNGKWKHYNDEFDNYSEQKNSHINLIVFLIFVIIIFLFAHSFFLIFEYNSPSRPPLPPQGDLFEYGK